MRTKNIENGTKVVDSDPQDITNAPHPVVGLAKEFPSGYLIDTLVALCPLLGLLGTVTGMIEVFNVMAVTGGGDAKSMAGGVEKATIPTMAGMVAALSGLFANTYIQRIANREQILLEDQLTSDH